MGPIPITRTPTTAGVDVAQPPSPWHSPVPYLFGGLAAMLGLIAFALLILACSYWKLSVGVRNSDNERDMESQNEKEGSGSWEKGGKVFEEKFLVIMAGNDKPTFIATAVSSKVEKREGEEKVENGEKNVQVEMGISHSSQEGEP